MLQIWVFFIPSVVFHSELCAAGAEQKKIYIYIYIKHSLTIENHFHYEKEGIEVIMNLWAADWKS